MVRARVVVTLLMLAGVTAVRPAQADIYSFEDASGVVHFTNVPADPRYTVALHEPSYPPARAAKDVPTPGTHNRYSALVEKAAREHDVDPALLRAVIAVESAYNPRAVSPRGAVGLMQLMPSVAQRYGVSDRYDPVENVHAGASYLQDLMQRFGDDISLVLAAYNAGEDAVARYGNRIPPYPETLSYVPRVMDMYRRYRPDSP